MATNHLNPTDDVEKKEKTCAVGTRLTMGLGIPNKPKSASYTEDEVEKLIVKFEKAAAKQASKAPEDVKTAEQEMLKPSFTSAERELMIAAEDLRNICNTAVVGTKPAERDFLDDVFGRGCDCTRFVRMRDVLDKVVLSSMNRDDPRWQHLTEKILTIEEILKARGSFDVEKCGATASGVYNFKYTGVKKAYDLDEQVNMQPEVDGKALSYSIDRPLPDGLNFNEETGAITGAPKAATPLADWKITCKSAGADIVTTVSFGVSDLPPTGLSYPSLKSGGKYLVAEALDSKAEVKGGSCTEFSIDKPLPPGMSLDKVTGELSGSCSDFVEPTTYTITGKNSKGKATCEFSLGVTEPAPTGLTYAGLKDQYLVGDDFSGKAAVEGGPCTNFSVSPALPKGMSLNATTGELSGSASTLTEEKTYTVTAKNTGGEATYDFKLGVTEDAPKSLTYKGFAPEGSYLLGDTVSAKPQVTGGDCTNWTVDSPLPNGVTLNASTGEVSGMPTALTEPKTYTITGKNFGGEVKFEVTLGVTELAPTALSYPDLKAHPDSYAINDSVDAKPVVEGGACSNFSCSPELPRGMSLDSTTGVISGTAAEVSGKRTYTITGKNHGGETQCVVELGVVKEKIDLVKIICDCNDITKLLTFDAEYRLSYKDGQNAGVDTWMVWMVHRAHLNDPTLTELDFTDQKMPFPNKQPKVGPKLMKALETNTCMTTLKLTNARLERETGYELAKTLNVNKTLKVVDITGNDLDPDCIKALVTKLGENSDTEVQNFFFKGQKTAGDYFGSPVEKAIEQMMKVNNTLCKIGITIKDAGSRDNVDRYTLRNVDRARRLAATGGRKETAVAEIRMFSAIEFMTAPAAQSAAEVFAEDAETMVIAQGFCAEKLQVPTKEQLQAFAKNAGKPIPFAKAAPAATAFRNKLLDAGVGCKVSMSDEAGTPQTGTLRSWKAPTENDWTFEMMGTGVDDGKLLQYNGKKQPPIKAGADFVAWLRP